MFDRVDASWGRSRLSSLAEPQIVRFIGDALVAGGRAILVTSRDQQPAQVPEAALAARANATARTLHIGPPLPGPAELQEMIGAAADIAGGHAMNPLAMAARMTFTDQRQTVILAIDDAHTLSHQSLSYLAEITELLAPDAPVLQIVLAAKPAILDTLALPEFERLRNKLCRPEFQTLRALPPGDDGGISPGPGTGGAGALAAVRKANPRAASRRIARSLNASVVAVAAMICLAVVGFDYLVVDFGVDPTPFRSLISASLQRYGAASEPTLLVKRSDQGVEAGVSAPSAATTVDAVRAVTIAKTAPIPPSPELSAKPETAHEDRAASPEDASTTAGAATDLTAATQPAIGARMGQVAHSLDLAEQRNEAEKADRASSSRTETAPTSSNAVTDRTPAAQPAIMANAAPAAPASELSADGRDAADEKDRAASSPNDAMTAGVSGPNAGSMQPPVVADATPNAPDDRTVAAEPPQIAQPPVPPLRPRPSTKVVRVALDEEAGASHANSESTRSSVGVRRQRNGIWAAVRATFGPALASMFNGRRLVANEKPHNAHRGRQL